MPLQQSFETAGVRPLAPAARFRDRGALDIGLLEEPREESRVEVTSFLPTVLGRGVAKEGVGDREKEFLPVTLHRELGILVDAAQTAVE